MRPMPPPSGSPPRFGEEVRTGDPFLADGAEQARRVGRGFGLTLECLRRSYCRRS